VREKKVVTIDRFADESSTGKEFEHRLVIQNLLDASPSRRKLLRTLGMASAMAGAVAVMDKPAQAQSSFTDVDILNFALNLEYLEAEFYTIATTGKNISQINLTVSGGGVAGSTQGGALVPLTGAMRNIALEIATDERTHVTLLQSTITSLGGSPIAKPAINLNALGFGFANANDFLALARIFEDIGVTAYGGAAPLITSKTVLGYAARILATEAYHASNIRLQIAQNNIPTTALDGADHIPPPSGKEYFPLDANAITEVRTPGEVLFLAFGSANASSGGFFPGGVNGLFNTSSASAATSDTGTSTDNDAISASPNPVPHTASGFPMTTISWNAPGASAIEIHVGSPTGSLFASGNSIGSAPTGAWVMEGLTLYLQDVSGGKALTAANTLGTVVLHVS
jgi:hypothetical protein